MENSVKSYKYSDFVLYSYWRASCPWRIRIALNLKGIEYKIVPINLLKGEDESESYLKINPHGKIPTLEFKITEYLNDNEVSNKTERLYESTVILEFLEETFPDNYPLLPKDNIIEKCKIKSFALHVACNIHPIQNINVLNKIGSLNCDKLEWAKFFICTGLESLEDLVKNTKGKYCFGDVVTMADIYLYPQLYWFKRNNIELKTLFPTLYEIQQNLSVLKAFIDAEPENQIDAVKS